MRLSLQLAISSLKKNKKRSMVALLAIIITIGFLTAINQISINSKQNRIIQAKRLLGEYHFKARLSGKEEEEKFIETLPEGSEYGMDSYLGEIKLNDNFMARISGVEEIHLKSVGSILVEGRFPENPYEICIEENSIKEWGIKRELGEKFKKVLIIQGKAIEIEFTLVGITDSTNSALYGYAEGVTSAMINDNTTPDILKSLDIDIEEIYNNQNRRIEVILPSVHKDLIIEIQELISDLKFVNRTSINYNLLNEINNLNNEKKDYLTMAVIIIACMIFIFNIFNISALEKIKEYGTLRALGCTKEGMYQLVILEAMILSLIAIPIGILLGSGIGYSIMGFVNNRVGIETLINEIQYKELLWISLLGMGVIYISAIIPANRTAKIQPVDALRYITNNKKTKKNKLGIIFDKIGGIKLRLAYDNMWINKSRTIITIISIAGSVAVMFLAIYAINNNKFAEVVNEKYSLGDFEIKVKDGSSEDGDKKIGIGIVEEIESIDERIEIFGYDELPNGVIVEDGGKIEELEGLIVYGFDDNLLQTLNKYLSKGELDIKGLNERNSALIIDRYSSTDKGSVDKYIEENVLVGDKIVTKDLLFENGKPVKTDLGYKWEYSDIYIAGVVSKLYPFLDIGWSKNNLEIIVPKDKLKSYLLGEDLDDYVEGYINIVLRTNATDEEELEKYENLIRGIAKENNLDLISYKEETEKLEEQVKNIKLMISIVISTIMALGLMNIITTVTTNIIQRTREFATIRAVGVTREEMGQIIIYEGLCWGLISGIISIILALFGSIALGKIMSIENILSTIPWLQYLITLIGVVAVCTLITLIPLKKVLKSNVIESLREM